MISKNSAPLPAEEERGEPDSEVARAARWVLEIVPGERRLLPEFGCRVHEVESLATPVSREVAAALVEDALERWVPRLRVDRAEVVPSGGGKLAVRLRAGGNWHSLEISHRHPSAARDAGGVLP